MFGGMKGRRSQIGLYRIICDWIAGKAYSTICMALDCDLFFVCVFLALWIRKEMMALRSKCLNSALI